MFTKTLEMNKKVNQAFRSIRQKNKLVIIGLYQKHSSLNWIVWMQKIMEQYALKNVNNSWNINIYIYLETSVGQNSNVNLIFVRHLWQFKIVVFPHTCLIRAVLFVSLIDKKLKKWFINDQICLLWLEMIKKASQQIRR